MSKELNEHLEECAESARKMVLRARKVSEFYFVCLVGDSKADQQRCEGYEPYVDEWCKHCLEGDCATECDHPGRRVATTEPRRVGIGQKGLGPDGKPSTVVSDIKDLLKKGPDDHDG
jgi:hypothetical protein